VGDTPDLPRAVKVRRPVPTSFRKLALFGVLALASCGGSEDAPRPEPRPVTNEQAARMVGQLADELRWGCGNLDQIRAAARRVEQARPRVEMVEARQLMGQAVREARDTVVECP
jgi:lysophospholipase L1-like esterase